MTGLYSWTVLVAAIASCTILAGATGAAARDDRHREREHWEHRHHHRHRYERHHHYERHHYESAPRTVYERQPVMVLPAPVYMEPTYWQPPTSPSLNLNFTIPPR